MTNQPERYFSVKNWADLQDYDHKSRKSTAPWLKLPTTFFDDPAVYLLPDSQKIALIGIWIMAAKCRNRVRFDATYIKKRVGCRVTPDLELFLAQGLIEISDRRGQEDVGSRGEERRVEEIRGEEKKNEQPPLPPPETRPDVLAENRIRQASWDEQRDLLRVVAKIAEYTGRDPPEVMRHVTAYKRRDGSVAGGRVNPALLTPERVTKSLEDAKSWLADLEKKRESGRIREA